MKNSFKAVGVRCFKQLTSLRKLGSFSLIFCHQFKCKFKFLVVRDFCLLASAFFRSFFKSVLVKSF